MMHKVKKQVFQSFLRSRIFVSSDHLGGVLSQLRNSSSSNVEYLKKFTITESCSGKGTKESVFNYEDNAMYHTCGNDYTPKWLQIEMRDIYLTIKGYTLMSYSATCCHYPKSWYLEGRNSEKDDWQRIDERHDENELDGVKAVKQFTNNLIKVCKFRIFRLTMTDNYRHSQSTNTYLALNEMDFIGKISSVPYGDFCLTRRCSCRNTQIFISFFVALFITRNAK